MQMHITQGFFLLCLLDEFMTKRKALCWSVCQSLHLFLFTIRTLLQRFSVKQRIEFQIK